jgi:hypothetical protein
MRFDLKVPCKNCPFRNGPNRITFACRERAEEIEESAYRQGFPCHLSATDTSDEDEDEERGGYEFAVDGSTQHCAGAAAMFLLDGYDSWPGIDNDEELGDRLRKQLAEAFPLVFQSTEEFFEANTNPRFDEAAE